MEASLVLVTKSALILARHAAASPCLTLPSVACLVLALMASTVSPPSAVGRRGLRHTNLPLISGTDIARLRILRGVLRGVSRDTKDHAVVSAFLSRAVQSPSD
jgi:hypothetical protein